MPMMSREAYDNLGNIYNVERILNADGMFDLEKYKAYSPLFLSCVFPSAHFYPFTNDGMSRVAPLSPFHMAFPSLLSVRRLSMHFCISASRFGCSAAERWRNNLTSMHGSWHDTVKVVQFLHMLLYTAYPIIVPAWWYGVIFGNPRSFFSFLYELYSS